ncbi:thermonuclease family protein [Cereibacter sphaeroides]|uniref:thermonuclease family protein n=1 Tax=Cereibacter sphaeroides TaxID=1063 RepID=UPI003AF01AA7
MAKTQGGTKRSVTEDATDDGKAVAEAVRARIEGKSLYICSIKAKRSDGQVIDSFGRYLAVVYENGESVNDWLLASGMAVPFEK